MLHQDFGLPAFRFGRAVRVASMCAIAIAFVMIVHTSLIAAAPAPRIEEDELLADSPDAVGCGNVGCSCGAACGCGAGCGCGTPFGSLPLSGASEFTYENIVLSSNVTLADFGAFAGTTFSMGNDCWGYTSPSGREYALMGLRTATAFVEITDPANPVILNTISHSNSLWSDIKTYQDHAYVMTDQNGVGLQVVDLSNIDAGVVTLVNTVTTGGLTTSHNLVVNEDSGFLYITGANLGFGGLLGYDLSDPVTPVFAGSYTLTYVHDAQVVNMMVGEPPELREIAFCYAGGNGVDIVDVTDKGNMTRLSRTPYAGLAYTHQGWYDADTQLIYTNDELDEMEGLVGVTTTRIFDVSDLSNPQFMGVFSNGMGAIDHNLYVRDGFIYESNYRTGLRIFDANTDPLNPVEVGFFDTFPNGDGPDFNGAWSNYPYFASGTVIVSDIERGLFVFDPSFALAGGTPLDFTFPGGLPASLGLSTGMIDVDIAAFGNNTLDPASPMLVYDDGSGFQTSPMTEIAPGQYRASFGAIPCEQTISYYFTAQTTAGLTVTSPLGAPMVTHTAIAAENLDVTFDDDFELVTGWTVGDPSDTASTGVWVRADPVGTIAQPEDDNSADGTLCFITGNANPGDSVGTNDIDNGATTLTSPLMDAIGAGGDAFLSYAVWYSNDANAAIDDTMTVEISNDDGQSWTTLEQLSQANTIWLERSFRVADFVTPTNQMRVRFIASDLGSPSIVEAGVDECGITIVQCAAQGPIADLNGDGFVGSADFALLLGAWGPCPAPPANCISDLDGDGNVGASDAAIMLGSWG